MKKVSFLALIALASFAVTGYAQTNAGVALLDSPYKIEAETQSAGETLVCTVLVGGGTASLFGCDEIFGTSPVELIENELFGTYRVFHFDENCATIGTWFTAFVTPGFTSTGISVAEPTGGTTYWNVDPFGSITIGEYVMFSGASTGASAPLPVGFAGVWGPLAIDNNQPGMLSYVEDIASDVAVEVDLVSGVSGCSFPNPDNGGGGGAFGNGMSEASVPAKCGGTTLVITSGLISEGQVTRASQTDCSGVICRDTWDLLTLTAPSGEFFPNGYEEFNAGTSSMVAGNVTGIMFHLVQAIGIRDCQGTQAVVYANASQGGSNFTVGIDNTNPLGMAIQNTDLNGKFVVHMNAGSPSSGTITTLPAGIGDTCYDIQLPPFGSGSPEAVWNNIGKTNRIGASNYFGTPISDPGRAPTFFHADADGDTANLGFGSEHTVQGIILTSGFPKNAGITNALKLDVTAGL